MIIKKWIFLPFFQVRNIFVHEAYNATNIENDIAMLVLNSSVQITAEVRPVCLWNQGDTSLESIIGKDGVVRSNFQVTFIILEYIKF
jgi:secreted trypsin-like serine protease